MLPPGQSVTQAFKRALDFSGRSRRSAYWWFALFTSLGGVALQIVDENVHIPGLEDWSVFFLVFCAIVVLPDLSLGMRRLHDTGRSGWLYIVWMIVSYGSILLPDPNFGFGALDGDNPEPWDLLSYGVVYSLVTVLLTVILMIILIILLTRDSQVGQNAYGKNPKNLGNPDVFS